MDCKAVTNAAPVCTGHDADPVAEQVAVVQESPGLTGSLTVALLAVFGPTFVTTIEYVVVEPACTVLTLFTLVTRRSASVAVFVMVQSISAPAGGVKSGHVVLVPLAVPAPDGKPTNVVPAFVQAMVGLNAEALMSAPTPLALIASEKLMVLPTVKATVLVVAVAGVVEPEVIAVLVMMPADKIRICAWSVPNRLTNNLLSLAHTGVGVFIQALSL